MHAAVREQHCLGLVNVGSSLLPWLSGAQRACMRLAVGDLLVWQHIAMKQPP